MWGPNSKVNKKFMNNLAARYGQSEFTTKEAEWLYLFRHCDDIKRDGFDIGRDYYWAKATARQNLSIATERGILIRVRKGLYKFNK